MKNDVLVVLALLIGSLALTSCGKIEDPQFRRFEGFGLKHFDFNQPTVGFNVAFYNPNNFGVSVKEAAFDLYVDTVYLGKFTQSNEIAVTPEAEFKIPMEGQVSWAKAINSSLPKLAGKEVDIKADGAVKIGKAGVFISKSLNYKGRHKLDLDLIKNPAAAGFLK